MDEDDLLTPYKEETYEQYEQRPLGSPSWISDNSVDELIGPIVVAKYPSPRPEKVVVQTEAPDTADSVAQTPDQDPNEDLKVDLNVDPNAEPNADPPNADVKDENVIAEGVVKTEEVPKRRKGRPPKKRRKCPWMVGRVRKPKPEPSETAVEDPANAEQSENTDGTTQPQIKTETAAGEPVPKRPRGRPRRSEEIAMLRRQLEEINAIVPEGTKRKTRPSRLLDDYDTFVPDEKRPRGRPRKGPVFPGKVQRLGHPHDPLGEKRRRGRPRVKPAKIRYLFPDGTAKQGRPPRDPSTFGLLPFIKNAKGELVLVERDPIVAETGEAGAATVAPKKVKVKIPRVKRRPGRPRTKPPKFRLLYPDGTPLRPGRPPRNFAKLGILPFIKNDRGEYVPLARFANGPSTSQVKIEKGDIKEEAAETDDKGGNGSTVEDPAALLNVKMETEEEDVKEPMMGEGSEKPAFVAATTSSNAAVHIKRGRGRPRIHPLKAPRTPKRQAREGKKLGRPKKSVEKMRKAIPAEGESSTSNPRWRIKVGGLFKFLTGNKSAGLKACDESKRTRSRRSNAIEENGESTSSTRHDKEEAPSKDVKPSIDSAASNDNPPVAKDIEAPLIAHKSTAQEKSNAVVSKESEPDRFNGAYTPARESPKAAIVANTKHSPVPDLKSPVFKKSSSPSVAMAPTKKVILPTNVHSKMTSQMNPNTKMTSQNNPNTKMISQINPNTKMTSQMNPNTKMTSQVNPSTKMTSQINPSTKLTSQVNPSTKMTSQTNPNTKMTSQINPSTKLTSQVNPSTKMTSQTNPNTKMTSQINPSTKLTSQVNPNTKITSQINPNTTTVDKSNFTAAVPKPNIGLMKPNITPPPKKYITVPRLKVTVPEQYRTHSKNPLINKLNSFNTSITLQNTKQPTFNLKTTPQRTHHDAPNDDSDDDCIIVSSTLPSSSSSTSTNSPLICKMNTTTGAPQFLQSLTPPAATNGAPLHMQSFV